MDERNKLVELEAYLNQTLAKTLNGFQAALFEQETEMLTIAYDRVHALPDSARMETVYEPAPGLLLVGGVYLLLTSKIGRPALAVKIGEGEGRFYRRLRVFEFALFSVPLSSGDDTDSFLNQLTERAKRLGQ